MAAREALKTEEQFDIDDALNEPGFAEFLACFPEAERMINGSDAAGIEGIFRTFEDKEEIVGGLKDVCKSEILRDTAIEPEDTDLEAIDAYIHEEFKRNPEAAIKMLENLSEFTNKFRDSQERIAEKEEQLEELGGFTKLRELKRDLKSAAGVMGFVNGAKRLWNWESPSKKGLAAKQRIAEEFGIVSLGDVKKKLSALGSAEKAASEFSKMRELLFANFAPMREVTDIMQIKAQEKLKALFDPDAPFPDLEAVDLENLEKAQQYFDQLSQGTEGGHIRPATGAYLEGFDAFSFQGQLDLLIETKIIKSINDAIVGHTLGGNALSRLEGTLMDFLNKQEVGSRKGDLAKDFIKRQVDRAIKDPKTPPANRYLAMRVLIKCFK